MIDIPKMVSVNFAITSKCNLSCPNCCSNIPFRTEHSDVSWEYIERAAGFFRNKISILKVTGGEPLMHKEFDQLAPKLVKAFRPAGVGIETNGFLAPRHKEGLEHFDFIHVTVYDESVFRWQPLDNPPNNTEQRKWMKDTFGDKVGEVRVEHTRRDTPPKGGMCGRGTTPIGAYWNGKLYPCCIGDGIDDAVGIELDDEWQEKIRTVRPPCHKCWFSV